MSNTQPARAGDYTVVVPNISGSITSQVAGLSLGGNKARWATDRPAILILTPTA